MLFSYLSSAERTDIGRRRPNNEDAVLRLPAQAVFCVADGMGGTDAGEVASRAALQSVAEALGAALPDDVPIRAARKAERVAEAMNRASQWIHRRAQGHGMGVSGTTVSVLIFDPVTPADAVALHAGDSPIYLFRNGRLSQITRDHSFAVEAGYEDESLVPAQFRGVVTRAVGIDTRVELEQTSVKVQSHDLFLLCSDGLSRMLPTHVLRHILLHHEKTALDSLAHELIDRANEAGGLDNISVVLVRVGDMIPIAEAPLHG